MNHRVIVAGAGATGSHLLPHVARMADVSRITVVDPETYDSSNLAGQNIDKLDVGKPKACAQSQKLRLIKPRLIVDPVVGRLEDVPLASLNAALFIGCLDSRRARLRLNEIACRWNAVILDLGVLASHGLARVSIFRPSADTPCLECKWGPDDYAQVEQVYPCNQGAPPRHPTMASSALAGIAASIAAMEAEKILAGDLSSAVVGRELVLDASHHKLFVTSCRRNPECRFDHRNWTIDPWACRPESTTIGAAIAALGSIAVAGHRFVTRLTCSSCGCADNGLKLNRPARTCPSCRRLMIPASFDARDSLDSALPDEYRDLTLAQVGLRAGDVVDCGERHFSLTGEAA